MAEHSILTLHSQGENVVMLHQLLIALKYNIPDSELEEQVFGTGTLSAVRRVQARASLMSTGIVDERTWLALSRMASAASRDRGRFEGRVFSDDGLPVERIKLQLIHQGIQEERTIAETISQENGFYAFDYDPIEKGANLSVHVVKRGSDKPPPLSKTIFDAERYVELNLILPFEFMKEEAPEYERLAASINEFLGHDFDADSIKEDDTRKDLTLLQKGTQWDARLIGLKSMAASIAKELDVDESTAYGLLRLGLPSDTAKLANIDPVIIDQALSKAVEKGIINETTNEFESLKKSLSAKAIDLNLNSHFGGLDSVEVRLGKSGLTRTEKKEFKKILLEYNGDPDDLWKKANSSDKLNAGVVEKLQFHSKIAFLTEGNSILDENLKENFANESDLTNLVDAGLYHPDAWKERLRQASGGDADKLDALIPKIYVGTKAQRLKGYTNEMARKVRISYPTRVVFDMVGKGTLKLAESDVEKQGLKEFFIKADPLGFELGKSALGEFFKGHHDELFNGAEEKEVKIIKERLGRLQRLYQITPTIEALKALLKKKKYRSAADVYIHTLEDFLEDIKSKLVSPADGELIYRKAKEIQNLSQSFVIAAMQLRSTPTMHVLNGTGKKDKRDNLIQKFPTLESLFGTMDFCECEHCSSVLSPAAYFVDLLKEFLDPSPDRWDAKTKDWKKRHGTPYEHKLPYDELILRRPDLPHIPLTCENTHTVLPYIDLVNELLEYYIANGNHLDTDAAHDTGTATSAELLAEPQYFEPQAYRKLNEAQYPLSLPFDFWLEKARIFCMHLETPFVEILEVFRKSDNLFKNNDGVLESDQATQFREQLEMSPAEHTLLTHPKPMDHWWFLYGYTQEPAKETLRSAKTLSHRLGVSYVELVDLIRTRFLNPNLSEEALFQKLNIEPLELERLRKNLIDEGLGVDLTLLKEYLAKLKVNVELKPKVRYERIVQGESFEEILAKYNRRYRKFNPIGFELVEKINDLAQSDRLQKIIVLSDELGCSFEKTKISLVDGTDIDKFVYLKFNLFVRIWKRLGWSIDETDRALETLMPNFQALDRNNIGDSLKTALIHMAHVKELADTLKVGRNALHNILTFWSDIPTKGEKPLYAELFLKQSILKADPVFDHPQADYLNDNTVKLEDHLSSLKRAIGITPEDVQRILGDDLSNQILNLANVSTLYRHQILAKGLDRSIEEVIILKRLSEIDPFTQPSQQSINQLDNDHPFTKTLKFVKFSNVVQESGFELNELDYLLRHKFDSVGKFKHAKEIPVGLIKMLRSETVKIVEEIDAPKDPSGFTDEKLQSTLALVFSPDVTARFMAMWAGSIESIEVVSAVPAKALKAADYKNVNEIGSMTYDENDEKQSIKFLGVLTLARKTELENEHNDEVFSALLEKIYTSHESFFKNHFEISKVNGVVERGFLEMNDFETLFTPHEKQEEELKKRKTLLTALYPYIQDTLMALRFIGLLATRFETEENLAGNLLTRKDRLQFPLPNSDSNLLDVFYEVNKTGVSALFFTSADLQGASTTATVVDFDSQAKAVGTNDVAKAANQKSMKLNAWIEVPATSNYRFYITFGKMDSHARLSFSHMESPLIDFKATKDDDSSNNAVELKSGTYYQMTLEGTNLQDGAILLEFSNSSLSQGPLKRITTIPSDTVDRIDTAHQLFSKATHLINGLALNDRELEHIVSHASDFANLNLTKIPTLYDDAASSKIIFNQILLLVKYTMLRKEMVDATDTLIDVFELARKPLKNAADEAKEKDALLEGVAKVIADTLRRNKVTVLESLNVLGFTVSKSNDGKVLELLSVTNVETLERLWKALRIVHKLGLSVSATADAVAIADINTGVNLTEDEKNELFEQRVARAERFTDAVKSAYDTNAWLQVAPTLFDPLRQKKRDALVAYIMHKDNFASFNNLFEYFLIDPGMEPVVHTSRLRLAISSIQTFIQRCLLNLEEKVKPSMIDAKQWEWMKQYRVWEANRKIFLFPENWLEPEFRDDKSHLFQELESTLLQGDISNELAETAFYTYLQKLEKIGKLQMVAMYVEEGLEADEDILHVIGRTPTLPHEYFYRRRVHNVWTPWEPVSAEIEGNHIVAAVWRGRLHLFWVTFMERADTNDNGVDLSGKTSLIQVADAVNKADPPKIIDVSLNWSEYFQGEWTTRESNGFEKSMEIELNKNEAKNFKQSEVHIYARVIVEKNRDKAMRIRLYGSGINRDFEIESKNAPPKIFKNRSSGKTFYFTDTSNASRMYQKNAKDFGVWYIQNVDNAKNRTQWKAQKTILGTAIDYEILLPNDPGLDKAEIENWLKDYLRPKTPSSNLINDYRLSRVIGEWRLFFQDRKGVFLVEPTLTEKTIPDAHSYEPKPDPCRWGRCKKHPPIHKIPVRPRRPIVHDPGWTDPVRDDIRVIHPFKPEDDWLTNPGTIIRFKDTLIDDAGGIDLKLLVSKNSVGSSLVNPGNIGDGTGNLGIDGGEIIDVDDLRDVLIDTNLINRGTGSLGGGINRGGVIRIIGNGGLDPSLIRDFGNISDRHF